MKFEHRESEGDTPEFYTAEWSDGTVLSINSVQVEGRKLLATVHISHDQQTLLAKSSIDAKRPADRRAIAQSVLHDAPDWPARIEDACERLGVELDNRRRGAADSPMFIWAHELDSLPQLDYAVSGIMQRPGLGAIVGGPESMKSITLLDIAGCIGAGIPWHGFPVTAGFVVYIYAEGVAGLKSRRAAWEEANRRTMENVAFVPYAIPMLDADAVANLLNRIEQEIPMPPVAVFIDTLARAMAGGDENSTADMGRLIEAADQIKRATGAAVWFAHHNNKLGEYRGNTALLAGLDNAAAIERKADTVTISCLKSKDMEPFVPIELVRTPFAGSVALISETPESRIVRLQNNLSPQAHELLEALRPFPEGLKYGEWVDASGKSKGGGFQRPHDELKAAKVVVGGFGKWQVVPEFQTVPRNPGTLAESEWFQSSTTPVGGGTGTTFGEPVVQPLPLSESDSSKWAVTA